MPNLYARAAALTDVAGRVDYISSPHRQEKLLASYDGAAELLDGRFWKQLARESRDAFEQFSKKTYIDKKGNEKKTKCVEGREIMITLSNALLERLSPDEICKIVVDEFKEKLGLTVAVGLHLKHDRTGEDNLHVHVVFPECELLKEPIVKIADRALFYDADGKRRYKKSEILDENKQLLPGCKIIKKGEVYEQKYFGSVNPQYSYQTWLKDVKTNVILPLRNGKLKGDVEITEYSAETGKLPQQHIPKGTPESKAIRIVKCNEMVVKFNRYVDSGVIPLEKALYYQKKIMGAKDRNAVLSNVLWEVERNQGRKTIKVRTDWKVQNMIDAVRISREEDDKDFDAILKQRGQELGEAKREYARVQENGDFEDIMKAAKKLKEAQDRYKEVARIRETTGFRDVPTDPDDR